MIEDFFKNNSRWLLVVIFSAGIMYAEFKNVQTLEERLNKKIKVIQENEDKIHQLELRIVKLENCK